MSIELLCELFCDLDERYLVEIHLQRADNGDESDLLVVEIQADICVLDLDLTQRVPHVQRLQVQSLFDDVSLQYHEAIPETH